MERFPDGQYVWLRSRVHGGYLKANSDGRSVSLRSSRASLKAAWKVHIYQGKDGGGPYLLLLSAAYGRYLAATATRAPPLHIGYRAEQRDYDQPEVPAIMWRASEAGLGCGEITLRNVGGGRYLRANGKYLSWNKGVTVDGVDNISNMMYWTVQTIPLRDPGMPHPDVAPPVPTSIRQKLSVKLARTQGAHWLIQFTRASPEGVFNEDAGRAHFHFRGRYAFHLRTELAAHLLPPVPFFEVAMSVRAGRYGNLTPLLVNLPHGGTGETLQIVVYLSDTPAYNALRFPNVDAE